MRIDSNLWVDGECNNINGWSIPGIQWVQLKVVVGSFAYDG
jgi:hypothetical protein